MDHVFFIVRIELVVVENLFGQITVTEQLQRPRCEIQGRKEMGGMRVKWSSSHETQRTQTVIMR